MVISDYSLYWSQPFHFGTGLSKSIQTSKTTTWIWNLHATPHDFSIQGPLSQSMASQAIAARKVISANISHLSLLCLFMAGLHYDGAYFSNYCSWIKDPRHVTPSSRIIWGIVGQDILNADLGGYFQGCESTTGMYNLWRASGCITQSDLKYATCCSLIIGMMSLILAYFYMHCSSASTFTTSIRLAQHIIILMGLASLGWTGHCIHIAEPMNRLLDSGIDPNILPSPFDVMLISPLHTSLTSDMMNSHQSILTSRSIFEVLLNPTTTSLSLRVVAEHHGYQSLVLLISSLISFYPKNTDRKVTLQLFKSNLSVLSINLLLLGVASMIHAHHIAVIPVYPYLSSDFPTLLSLQIHHIFISSCLIVGSGAHSSIFVLRDMSHNNYRLVFETRDAIVGMLIYISLFLGCHAFGIYIHNDTLQACGRQIDMIQDNSIQLKPVFAILADTIFRVTSFDTDVTIADAKIVLMSREQGTADFMVSHIHAFTFHTTLLVLIKGILYARGSRLVSSKHELGFMFPCDGPGRGGTCQISSFDHLYLAAFWAYNSFSVLIFHYFWKQQSDVLATFTLVQESSSAYTQSYVSCKHISSGDFSVHSCSINGWLRNFLWSGSSQVIQSYGSSLSIFGLLFLLSHFVWSFSLMFLFSGRGYWQELLESIVWAHQKLMISNTIKARALSITHGRIVGLFHFIAGGVGCSYSFIVCRIIALS